MTTENDKPTEFKLKVSWSLVVAFILAPIVWYYSESPDLFGLIFIPSLIWICIKQILPITAWDDLVKTRVSLDHEKSLHAQGLFWLPIAFFGTISLWVGLFSTTFDFALIYDPLKVVSALKIPVSIWALCIPFTVAIGRFHASAQNAASLDTAKQTQSFRHYFDHREAFRSFLIEEVNKVEFFSIKPNYTIDAYSIIFPNSKMDNFDLKYTPDILNSKLEKLTRTLESEAQNLSNILQGSPKPTNENLNEYVEYYQWKFTRALTEVLKDFGLKFDNALTLGDNPISAIYDTITKSLNIKAAFAQPAERAILITESIEANRRQFSEITTAGKICYPIILKKTSQKNGNWSRR